MIEAVVLEPEKVQAGLVAGDELLVSEVPEPFGFPALVPILRVVAGDEVVQVVDLERLGLEGEVLVGAQVVNPSVQDKNFNKLNLKINS